MGTRGGDQRGVALPMALMGLALLTPLMLAFAALSVSEPVIASNQLLATQARALADGGVQYALWRLSGPDGGAPFTQGFLPLAATGGFTVQVTVHAGGDPQARTITAVGWVPAPDAAARAHRQVIADAVAIPRLAARAPCALCVRGGLELDGNIAIDGANGDRACGNDDRFGTFTGGATSAGAAVRVSGGAGASAQDQPAPAFEALTLSGAALEALRAIALRHGTYYGPGFPSGGRQSDGGTTWDGRLVFDATHRLPDGIVFVDTTDGRDVAPGDTATLATVRLGPDAVAAADGVFRGWLVVNGALRIEAGARLQGLVYAADTLTYRAAGSGSIEGLAVILNASGAPARLETTGGGALSVTFSCRAASGEGLVPPGWTLIPGSYREERD
jgi:hypothetical protein